MAVYQGRLPQLTDSTKAEPANIPYSFDKACFYHSQMHMSAHISDYTIVQVVIPSFTLLVLFSLSCDYCDIV